MPAFQPLGVEHKALAIPEQQLDEMTPAPSKGENLAAERVLELPRHKGGQTVEAAAHVGGSRGQPNLHTRWWRDHPRSATTTRRNVAELTSASTRTRMPLSSSISIRPGRLASPAGRETAARGSA